VSRTIAGATDLPQATFGAVNPDILEHFVAGSSSLRPGRVIKEPDQAEITGK
jgi:hypothetical protein